ncbi:MULTISPECIES: hypothetical protein [Leptospira]|uniref:Uncharacterized protein n=1 Tax=Leptospira selangorensis TaxID=2484982 RepID=A0ABY2MZB6_9LEPT|nr:MULTISPECIES: hypothetical protein [Leptospira]TGM03580.1 hypothetical protein EHQ79_06270 [Leptospira jelokensis]TGM12561.1 hypothetical protein EHQ82_19890 [Leptospira selangorensis]
MNIKTKFDHFLIYSKNLEYDFKRIREKFNFPIIYPINDYGMFKSAMFACKNSIIELVHFENPNIPESARNLSSWFSGIALNSKISIDNIKDRLQNSGLSVSDIIIQDVKDKEGNSIPISKILLINDLIQNLQIFYIEYLNNFLLNKFEELSKDSKWKISSFIINEIQTDKTKEQFINLGFNYSDNSIFSDINNIKFSFEKADYEFPKLNSFIIKSDEEIIDLVNFIEQ